MQNFFNNDPLLDGFQQQRSQLIEEYRRKVEMQGSRTPLWDKIDNEIAPLTDEQKRVVFDDEDYKAIQVELGQMVQEQILKIVTNYNIMILMVEDFIAIIPQQILKIVKPQIEGTERGKELLSKVYDIAVVAKKKAISETNKEMELFKRWQSYSVAHPEATYAEFVKSIKKTK